MGGINLYDESRLIKTNNDGYEYWLPHVNWFPEGLQREGALAHKELPSDQGWRSLLKQAVRIARGDSIEFLLVNRITAIAPP